MNSRNLSNKNEKTPEKVKKAVSKREQSIDKPVRNSKGPLNAYNYFCKDERPKVNQEGLTGKNVDIELGIRWRNLSPKNKEKYLEMQSLGKKEYQERLENKDKSNVDKSKSENKNAKTVSKKTSKKNDLSEKNKRAKTTTKKSKVESPRPSNEMMQFKITLIGTTPKVWRLIQVPINFNFYQLHSAIQDSIPFYDCHLHLFRIRNKLTDTYFQIGLETEDSEECEILDETPYMIKDYFDMTDHTVRYEYDFGDSWQLDVTYEGIFNTTSETKLPICLDGKNPGPPEDIGGCQGFMDFIEVVKNKDDPEHDETVEWYKSRRSGCNLDKKDFVPTKFDVSSIEFRQTDAKPTGFFDLI